MARRHGFSYTRYVDDLTLSGSKRLSAFEGLVQKILRSEGFKLKPKRSFMLQSERQVITKLVVNRKPNVPKERLAEIRKKAIREIDDGGGQVSPSTKGKLDWVKSINNDVGSKLLRRFHPA